MPDDATPDEQTDTPEEFQGERVRGVKVKVKGDLGDPRLNARLRIGQEVVIVATAICDGIAYGRTPKEGLMRSQAVVVDDGFIVLDALDALDLLHRLRAERNTALEAIMGEQGDLFNGDDGGEAPPPDEPPPSDA